MQRIAGEPGRTSGRAATALRAEERVRLGAGRVADAAQALFAGLVEARRAAAARRFGAVHERRRIETGEGRGIDRQAVAAAALTLERATPRAARRVVVALVGAHGRARRAVDVHAGAAAAVFVGGAAVAGGQRAQRSLAGLASDGHVRPEAGEVDAGEIEPDEIDAAEVVDAAVVRQRTLEPAASQAHEHHHSEPHACTNITELPGPPPAPERRRPRAWRDPSPPHNSSR